MESFFFYLLGVFDPYKYSNTDMLKVHGLVYETLMENEENQIRGYVHLVDVTGVNLPYMTLFTPKEAVRIVKNAEVNIKLEGKYVSLCAYTSIYLRMYNLQIEPIASKMVECYAHVRCVAT